PDPRARRRHLHQQDSLPVAAAVAAAVLLSRPLLADPAHRRSLFDSMSNHIANSVNWLPEISSSATRTIVGVVISLPFNRRMASIAPRRRPANVIRIPSA